MAKCQLLYPIKGIGIQLTFEYFKGSNGHFARCEESRVFTFWPVRGIRLHLDLAGLLFSIAYHRGVVRENLVTIIAKRPVQSNTNIPIPLRVGSMQDPVFIGTDLIRPWSSRDFRTALR
jgi:hypothetical protein